MKREIIDAIAFRHLLELRYNGFARTVEPHAYGRDKGGEEILRCFQISGGSESGERIGWKLLKVAEAYSMHPLKATFVARLDYKRDDKAMAQIFAQI